MKIKFFLIALLLSPLPAFGQTIPADTLPTPVRPDSALADSLRPANTDTIPPAATPDSLARPDSLAMTDSLRQAASDTLIPLKAWAFHRTVASDIAVTDSLLRWELWPSITDRMHRRPGVISYRQGIIGHPDALQIGTTGPNEQTLNWEQMPLNDPVSGTVNWNFMPLHKITRMEQQEGVNREYRFRMNPYYLVKPLSQLYYTESKHNYRNLEFMVTRNFTRRTNVELSYWYRKDGGGYPRTDMSGNQIYGRVWHQFDKQNALQAALLYNSYDLQESFGYVVPDLTNYSFSRFDATPQQNQAKSNNTLSSLQLGYYRRAKSDSVDRFQAWGWMQNYNRRLRYSADTTEVKLRTLGTGARRKWKLAKNLMVETAGEAEYNINRLDTSVVTKSAWSRLRANGEVTYEPFGALQLKGRSELNWRSTGQQGYGITGEVRLDVLPGWSLRAHGSIGERMPTVEELYWKSDGYRGDGNLSQQKYIRRGVGTSWKPDPALEMGLEAEQEQTKDFIYLMSQADGPGVFRQDNRILYETSARAFANWNSTHWELSGSATVHRYDKTLTANGNYIVRNNPRMWFKGDLYWKGYVISRAAFVKAGLYGMFTPGAYGTLQYQPELNRWSYPGSSRDVPSFYRVDAELTARLRWMMIMVRWENVLDNVGQFGYFETVPYPMPNRRFMFGIRAIFRD